MKKFLLLLTFSFIVPSMLTASFWSTRRKNIHTEKTETSLTTLDLPSTLTNSFNDQFQINLPSKLGTIVESFKANKNEPLPLIIHIQDAHGYYSAQKNSAAILNFLAQHFKQKPLFVGVEGSWKTIDTSFLSAYPDQSVRKQTVESMLKNAEITGEEYLSILEPNLIFIEGIEDQKSFEANLKSRSLLKQERPLILDRADHTVKRLQTIKQKAYSAPLLELDQKVQNYNNQILNLSDYVNYLSKLSFWQKNAPESLKNFAAIRSLETQISNQQLKVEIKSLVEKMQNKQDHNLLNQLTQKSLQFRLEKISALDYYLTLQKIFLLYKVPCPQTDLYINYLKKSKSINHEQLLKDLDNFTYQALKSFNPPSKILQLSENLALEKKFWNEGLSLKQWQIYQKQNPDLLKLEEQILSLENTLKIKHLPYVAKTSSEKMQNFPLSYPELKFLQQAYYKLAVKRDDALFLNFIEKLKEFIDKQEKETTKSAVLIAGGFHTDGVTRFFKKNNINYVVIRPNLNEQ